MTDYEIYAWEPDTKQYFLIEECDEQINTWEELREAQGVHLPRVRVYKEREDKLYPWDMWDIITKFRGGYFNPEPYEGDKSAADLLETATIMQADDLGRAP